VTVWRISEGDGIGLAPLIWFPVLTVQIQFESEAAPGRTGAAGRATATAGNRQLITATVLKFQFFKIAEFKIPAGRPACGPRARGNSEFAFGFEDFEKSELDCRWAAVFQNGSGPAPKELARC
jgi:hypothetical protein